MKVSPIFGLIVVVIVVVATAWFGYQFVPQTMDVLPSQPAAALATTSVPISGPTLSFAGATVTVDIADTDAERTQGLSGRKNLATDSGLLFIFDTPGRYGFWMKDMLFSIDMIWLDRNFKVITIKENATPESYPGAFYPKGDAQYVLEVPDGYASSHNIKEGDQATFSKGQNS